eukprot:symbB.v1.2.003672.t1/scaffold175.1/size369221/28
MSGCRAVQDVQDFTAVVEGLHKQLFHAITEEVKRFAFPSKLEALGEYISHQALPLLNKLLGVLCNPSEDPAVSLLEELGRLTSQDLLVQWGPDWADNLKTQIQGRCGYHILTWAGSRLREESAGELEKIPTEHDFPLRIRFEEKGPRTKALRGQSSRQLRELERIRHCEGLRSFFEQQYREGGSFEHRDYEDHPDPAMHAWRHKPTGITVWKDAIDLSTKEVYFHYTNEIGFRNITATEQEAAQVWASLITEGEGANAWPPDEWDNQEQLVDNNFRNMRRRDEEKHGSEYVKKVYPPRVAYCIPVLIDAGNAYDVSKRATPEISKAQQRTRQEFLDFMTERMLNADAKGQHLDFETLIKDEKVVKKMEELGITLPTFKTDLEVGFLLADKVKVKQGRNLGGKLLNEPGEPERCCVVLRVEDEKGAVASARSHLLNTLRTRAANASVSTQLSTAFRLGVVLRDQSKFEEAEKVLTEVYECYSQELGETDRKTLRSGHELAQVLWLLGRMKKPQTGQLKSAMKLQREILEKQVNELGEEDPETQLSNRCLAHILIDLDERKEAGKIFSRLLEVQKRSLPEKHHLVLATRDSLNFVLTLQLKAMEAQQSSGCPAEWEIAIKHHKENLECWKETHGKRHPHTLCARNNLAGVLLHLKRSSEAQEEYCEILKVLLEICGETHSDTLSALHNLAVSHEQMGEYAEAAKYYERELKGLEALYADPKHKKICKRREEFEAFQKKRGLEHPKLG